MQDLIDQILKAKLPPFLLTDEPGYIRVYFVTDLPILNEVKYKDKLATSSVYNLDNIQKAKVIHIGVAGRRIVKVTKRKIYHGDTSIIANLIQLAKAAHQRKNYEYPLLNLVRQLAQGDKTIAAKRLKLHIHESARFVSRMEAIDYSETLKANFLPSERQRIRYKFLDDLAATPNKTEATNETETEAHAAKLIKGIDDGIF